ncbi:hypothetical protein D1872_307640 [compost metagenome]
MDDNTDLDIGSRIFRKKRRSPQPSTNAASLKSRGIVLKCCRSININVAEAIITIIMPA